MKAEDTSEGVIAKAGYNPALSDEYKERFNKIAQNLSEHYFPNRVRALESFIIEEQEKECIDNKIEKMRFIISLQVLRDLLNQGWAMEMIDGMLKLSIQFERMNDKEKIRFRMRPEREAQFLLRPTKEFIDKMEKERRYNGQPLSIKSLYGSKELLIQGIQNQNVQIEPYIQLIEHGKDEHTGFWLNDIWRYFRYTWAIPYKTMPGRNLFYLVRDAAQPLHPVIGIFALGNTVLNLTVRDDDLGWTVNAIKKELARREISSTCLESLPKNNGVHAVKVRQVTETEAQHINRLQDYSKNTIEMLLKDLDKAISEIYIADLKNEIKNIKKPTEEAVGRLKELYEQLREGLVDNEKSRGKIDF